MGRRLRDRGASRSSTRRAAAPRRRWSRTSRPTTPCTAAAACSRSTSIPRASSARCSASTCTRRAALRPSSCVRGGAPRPESLDDRAAPRRATTLPSRATRMRGPRPRGREQVARRSRRAGSPATTTRRTACAAASPRSRRARGYDFVLIDAPPSFSPLTLNVLRAADEVVIPVPLTYLGARRLRGAAAHAPHRAHALRPPRAARLDGGAHVLSPHAPRARGARAAEARASRRRSARRCSATTCGSTRRSRGASRSSSTRRRTAARRRSRRVAEELEARAPDGERGAPA